MSIHVHLTHLTRYRYDRPVTMSPQIVRLRPAPHARTRIVSYGMRVTPRQHFLNWQQDPFSNWLGRVTIPEKTREFSVMIGLVADMTVINPFDFFLEPEAETWPFVYAPALAEQLAPYRPPSNPGPRLAEFLAGIPREPIRTVTLLSDLTRRVQQQIAYLIRLEPGVQSAEETLGLGSGSCRDSGWLLVQVLRHLGFAARFVSGYLIQLEPDQKSPDGSAAGPSSDFTDLHAWAEVYLPGAGWVGLDPTSGLFAGEGHIPLAASPEPSDAAPITGGHDKAEVEFQVEMAVTRLAEAPRVTKPYTQDQWQAILDCGSRIDRRIQRQDLRLTMGGEPTFVSATDRQGEEWLNAAVGPTKLGLAERLIRRLGQRFGRGGLLQHGQGKWYPGEPLPRWALRWLWRADGEPLWTQPTLIAGQTPARERLHAAGPEEAHALIRRIAARLGLDLERILPAFENPAHYLAREAALPENLSPGDERLEDPAERARLARVFGRGLTRPAGYVLPVGRGPLMAGGSAGAWISEAWRFRQGRLLLIPGDSPLGLRLPLESLPWLAEGDRPVLMPADPTLVEPLPARAHLVRILERRQGDPDPADAEAAERARLERERDRARSGTQPVRTALAVEPRDGVLHVFLPPVPRVADYLELLTVVEDAAAGLGLPIRIEGYPPPFGAGLNSLSVTPDPGVIEVNIHPATSWDEQVEITQILYEEARAIGLSTEKFQLDGRHGGTGGGNHIVVGGATPADSPFLRRPDLLGSLIRFWQRHPALSYLFSGLFIGPTSQAPRIDEGRMDLLPELELALAQVPDPFQGEPIQPWLVDRLFRNLLVDVTGNTHRAELCIDKLYSPDQANGRLGLVEMRAFEMPPHPQMALSQALLVRAILSHLWSTPLKAPLIRWGTALHDRFMLPWFLWEDLTQVLAELEAGGFLIDPGWFRPHWEFRCPKIGEFRHDGLTVELRTALEPWPVMGEEGMTGGTVRYVDSSVERLQILVEGEVSLPEEGGRAGLGRYVLAVNGVAVPLTPVAPNRAVAGLRYRAWAPAASLNPRLPVDGPVSVDLVDRQSLRPVAGCRYHVVHPGGRSYDVFPINAFEAEARRIARFERDRISPDLITVRPPAMSAEMPLTLDLRRQRVFG